MENMGRPELTPEAELIVKELQLSGFQRTRGHPQSLCIDYLQEGPGCAVGLYYSTTWWMTIYTKRRHYMSERSFSTPEAALQAFVSWWRDRKLEEGA